MFRRWRRDDLGAGVVEFALVLPIFLLIVTGLMDAARMVWQENTLAYAAREGTRYAIVHGSGSDDPATQADPSGVADRVRAAAVGVRDITVTVAWPDTSGGSPCYDRGCRVSVDATAQFVPLPSQYLMGGAFRITLRGGSMLVIH